MKQFREAFDEIEAERKRNAEELARLSELYEQKRREQEETQKKVEELKRIVTAFCATIGVDEGEFYAEMGVRI